MRLLQLNRNFSWHLYDMRKRKELPVALLSQKHRQNPYQCMGIQRKVAGATTFLHSIFCVDATSLHTDN
ncbi:hypothetical protein NUACC26_052200 [Scytonema sp. NUACC26]